MDGNILDLKEVENQMNQLVDRGYIEEMLKIQISEFEMLESMFSNPGELSVYDPSVLAHFKNYINGITQKIPNCLNFSIHLEVESNKLELCVNLPSEYPNLEPDVFVRSNDLNRNQQGFLNNCLKDFISKLERGEICINSAIAWLQENASQYFDKLDGTDNVDKPIEKSLKVFSRFWVYAHHIYSKAKRKEILEIAHEYNLTGFCLPGKPGIICVEGLIFDCEQWWLKIKSMNWRKIMLKKREDIIMGDMSVNEIKKFPDFQEISFQSKAKRKDYHMDFGEFLKYLTEHGCEYIFKDYFGMEGK